MTVHKQQRTVLARNQPFTIEKWFQGYKALAEKRPYHSILDSGNRGRFAIMGLEPEAVIKGKGETLQIKTEEGTTVRQGKLLEGLRAWMKQYETVHVPGYPDFQGGAIGYINYDLTREIERIPDKAEDDLSLPDLYFLIYKDVLVFDHEQERLWTITHYRNGERARAEQKLDQMESMLDQTKPFEGWREQELASTSGSTLSMSKQQFVGAVRTIQQYIEQGDVFQVNLSVRETRPLRTKPLHIYEKLRALNPSPYMGYFHYPEFQIVSGSPELLVKRKGEEIETRPIAGTRSRGSDSTEDLCLAETLIRNDKERAEHIMLVDLQRNDLGKVCRYGSVAVNELMAVEKYSHVMHIVSNVKGKLAKGYDSYDIIKAVFPGGTITGAPKVRTIEIIEEVEPVRRGVYTGSIGWIGFSGDMELNIAIRTMVAKDGHAYVQGGAGIVIDSDPEAEYKECIKKTKALWRAMELSEEEIMSQAKLR